ncbi:MAG: YfhO family protein [Myxococcales bacterium]|nr:YfhO family protein [Myxococcales bacterium]
MTRHQCLALTIGVIAAFIALTRGLWAGETLFFHDAATIARPLMSAGVEAFSRGELPLWDSSVGMGTPHLQNPILATFYPLLWPLAASPRSVLLFNAIVLLHLALAGAGAWRLGRALKLDDAACALGAVTLAFSGALLTSTHFVYLLFGWTWVPWALAGFAQTDVPPPSRAVTIAIPVALVLLSGCPDAAVALIVLGLALLMAERSTRRHNHQGAPAPSLRWVAAGLAVGVAIGMLQWAPTLAYWPESERAGGAAGAGEGLWSLHPARLIQFILPGFFGHLTPVNGYWGQAFTDTLSDGTFFFPELYLGGAALCLLPLAVTGQRRQLGRWVVAATALFVLVSLGRHGPVDIVPRVFRYPERWMFGASVGLALLAAIGLHALPSASPTARIAAGAMTGLVAAIGLTVLLADAPLADLVARTSLVPNVDAARGDQRLGAWIALGGAALLSVALIRPRWHVLALIATLVQLTAAHWPTIWTAAPEVLDGASARVVARLGPPPLRVARHPQLDQVPLHADAAGLWATWERHAATFRGNLGRHYDLAVLHDETPARIAHPLSPETAFWSDPVAFSRVFGVERLLVSAMDPPAEVARALGTGLIPSFGIRSLDLGVATPKEAPFPGAFCIGAYDHVDASDVREGALRPLERVPVESPSALPPSPGGPATACAIVSAPTGSTRHAEVTTPALTLLVFQTAYARGWSATIDGDDAPILRAYGSLASVLVTPGQHTIELRYEARGLRVGCWAAGAGLAALLALIAFGARSRISGRVDRAAPRPARAKSEDILPVFRGLGTSRAGMRRQASRTTYFRPSP